jgi:GNAT superfamily N-acetyltransferase
MAVREIYASGLEYLTLVTRLLQRARLADPEAGLWEAADLQWWWRTPRASDEIKQVLWADADGPIAAVALTAWEQAWGCDPIVMPSSDVNLEAVWARALAAIDALQLEAVDVLVRDDDFELRDLVTGSGFVAAEDRYGITWMDAEERPPVAPLPDGFMLVDRTVRTETPHPMRRRNGDAVEQRLQQCSLYDATLDLAIEAPSGEVAGYALFWFDPVTKVGLVEPMRIEDPWQRRGLARTILATGLDRLAAKGATRLKVSFESAPARALYLGSGFHLGRTDSTWVRRRPTVTPPGGRPG